MKTNYLLRILLVSMLFCTVCINQHAATGDMTIGGMSVSDLSTDASGTGWTWNATTETLTLTSAYTGQPVAINCVYTDTIQFNYTGNISISSSDVDALACQGSLKMSGSGGTLRLAYTGNSTFSGLYVNRKLVIYGGNIDASSSGSSEVYERNDELQISSYATAILSGFYEIQGNSNVSAIATGSHASGLFCWLSSPTISTTGIVTCSGTGIGYAIYVPNQMLFTISNGTINLSNNDNPENTIYTNKPYSRFIMTGGTVRYGNGTPPSLSSISPASGTYNGTATLTGANLSNVKGVSVNGKQASSVSVIDNNHVTFTIPSGETGSANILIETSGGAAGLNNAFSFTSTSYRVVFKTGYTLIGASIGFTDVEANTSISQPADPSPIPYYSTYVYDGGWYKDSNCTQVWDFATDVVTRDYMTIYAKYVEYSSIANEEYSSIKVLLQNDGFSIEGIEESVPLQVYDLNGKMLFAKTINSGEYVSMSAYGKGIYVLKMTINGESVTRKLIY